MGVVRAGTHAGRAHRYIGPLAIRGSNPRGMVRIRYRWFESSDRDAVQKALHYPRTNQRLSQIKPQSISELDGGQVADPTNRREAGRGGGAVARNPQRGGEGTEGIERRGARERDKARGVTRTV